MWEFLKFYSGKNKVYALFLTHAYWFLLMYFNITEKGKIKEKIWVSSFKNASVKQFQIKATSFSLNILPTFLYKEALEKLREHQNNGDRVIVVSASAEDWLQPWCEINNIELIATKLEKKDGKLTGKMATLNCKGPEKTRRIKELLNLDDYQSIYAYGDSEGDKEMLQIATFPNYRIFKK